MKFESKINLTKKDIEKIILDHLKATDTRGIVFKNLYFDVSSGFDDGAYGYSPAALNGATINVELEIP